MYAFANSGSQDNNNRFSTCSRESMGFFIRTRGQEGDDGTGGALMATIFSLLGPII
jgi:hypothetical protein